MNKFCHISTAFYTVLMLHFICFFYETNYIFTKASSISASMRYISHTIEYGGDSFDLIPIEYATIFYVPI